MTATLHIKKNRPFYHVLIRYQDALTGKHRQKCVTTDIPVKGNNKRKAEQRKDEILAQHMQDKVDLSKNVNFIEFMQQWLDSLKHSIEGSTYEAYKLTLDRRITPFFEPKKLKLKRCNARAYSSIYTALYKNNITKYDTQALGKHFKMYGQRGTAKYNCFQPGKKD